MQRSDPTSSAPPTDTDALVEEHLHLVRLIVHQLASRYPRHVDRDELWSAGATGLLDAARRYDASTGVPFARYASIRIRGAIIDSTRARDWATRSLRRRARTLHTHERTLEQELGRSPTTVELATASGLPVAQVEACHRGVQRAALLQLDQRIVGREGAAVTLHAVLRERDPEHLPQRAAERRELLGTVRVAVAHLDQPHRDVLVRHFFHDDLLQDIAGDLGVTEARVSQIRAEAINALRAHLTEELDDVPAVASSAPGRRRREAFVARMRAQVTWQDRFDAAPLARPA